MEKLLGIEELSEMLGITKATIYSWTSKNKIPYVKLSKKLLKFREEEIIAWIAQRSINPETKNSTRKIKKSSSSRASLNLHDDFIERIIKNAKKEVLN